MKNELRGKKILVLGHAISTVDIIKYCRQMGVYTIVADYLEDTSEKRAADESLLINPAEVEKLVWIVKDRNINAVFFGASEFLQERAMEICEKTDERSLNFSNPYLKNTLTFVFKGLIQKNTTSAICR